MNIQLPEPPNPVELAAIQAAIHPTRLSRYRPASNGSTESAFRIYVWNGSLCESFHIVVHFCEICTRNAIHKAVSAQYGQQWFRSDRFREPLSQRFRDELDYAMRDEFDQHGKAMTENHIVSAMTLGFWEHLTTKRFKRHLWRNGIQISFPSAPAGKGLDELRERIIKLRQWRNRIAHHRAIFDKSPMRKYQEALELISWSCQITSTWVAHAASVPVAISLRPKD